MNRLDPRYWNNAQLPPDVDQWLNEQRAILTTRISDLIAAHSQEVARLLFSQARAAQNLLARQEQQQAKNMQALLARRDRRTRKRTAASRPPPPPPEPLSESPEPHTGDGGPPAQPG